MPSTKNKPPIILEAYQGNLTKVKTLIDSTSNKVQLTNSIDHRGFTPLHAAAERGDLRGEIITLLLQNGAIKTKKTLHQETPYDIAVFYRRPPQIIKLLQVTSRIN